MNLPLALEVKSVKCLGLMIVNEMKVKVLSLPIWFRQNVVYSKYIQLRSPLQVFLIIVLQNVGFQLCTKINIKVSGGICMNVSQKILETNILLVGDYNVFDFAICH